MKPEQSQSLRELIRGAWVSTAGERPRFLAFVILFVIAYSVDLLSPWAIGYTLGVFVKGGVTDEAYQKGLLGIGAYILIRLTNNFCHHLGRYLQLTTSYAAKMKTLEGIFATILGFPLSWHVRHHSGENLSKLHRSTGAIDVTIGTYVWQAIEGLVKVVFASVAILTLDRFVALNVVAMMAITVAIMVGFNRRLVACIRDNNSFMDRLNRICVDHLANVITIKSLGLEKGSQTHLMSQRIAGENLNRKIVRFSELKWGAVGVGYSIVIGSSLFIYFSGHREMNAAIDVAEVYVLLNYLDRIFQAVGSFTAYYSGVIESATAYEDATKIIHESRDRVEDTHGEPFPANWKSLELRELKFTYSDASGEGLRDVQMTINRGDKIALVGPSGAGKSTLLKLMGGLLIPEHSALYADGTTRVPIHSVAQASLILPQEPEIFSESFRYNLTMGDHFTATELSFFVQLCRLNEVVEKLPQGWDSSLAESGMNISVGEKQRLAMARGLLRATPKQFILLDEPTSSLDPTTEKQIFLGLLHHFSDRTILTACHRLALVPLFDKIVFVRRGRIEEVGSFDELIKKRGPFFQTWSDYEERMSRGEQHDEKDRIVG